MQKYIEKGYGIHCDTIDDAEELLTWLDTNGYEWASCSSYIEEHKYKTYENKLFNNFSIIIFVEL